MTATSRGRLRIALLGTGWVADFHARAVREHPGAELVAAASWREPSLRALAERHHVPRTTTDWRELAADPTVDAAVVATPNALHAPQAIAFLEAGKHVRVETPMAPTLAVALTQLTTLSRGVLWNLQMAGALLFTIPVLIVFFFAQKVFVEGVTLTGVKG